MQPKEKRTGSMAWTPGVLPFLIWQHAGPSRGDFKGTHQRAGLLHACPLAPEGGLVGMWTPRREPLAVEATGSLQQEGNHGHTSDWVYSRGAVSGGIGHGETFNGSARLEQVSGRPSKMLLCSVG